MMIETDRGARSPIFTEFVSSRPHDRGIGLMSDPGQERPRAAFMDAVGRVLFSKR